MLQSRQIEAFRAVMLTGSMTLAAQAINVTQPAISRLVRDLEAELKLSLFQRRGNMIEPTASAHALLAEVERSFVGLSRIGEFAHNLRKGLEGTLRVAGLPAMAAGFLPRFIARYSRERPGVDIHLNGLPSANIRELVAAGQLDIGITAYPFHNPALVITPLKDRAVVIMPPDHALAAQHTVAAHELEDTPLVMLSKFGFGIHPAFVALQSLNGRQRIETPLSTVACTLVAEGLGVAVVDRFSASEFLHQGLVLRAFEPADVIGTALIHARNRRLSASAEQFRAAFLDHVRVFNQQIDDHIALAPRRPARQDGNGPAAPAPHAPDLG